jgi:hypothetical protein
MLKTMTNDEDAICDLARIYDKDAAGAIAPLAMTRLLLAWTARRYRNDRRARPGGCGRGSLVPYDAIEGWIF